MYNTIQNITKKYDHVLSGHIEINNSIRDKREIRKDFYLLNFLFRIKIQVNIPTNETPISININLILNKSPVFG